MATDVFHQLYFHVVWTTLGRRPVINDEARAWIIQAVLEECKKRDASVLACNTMPDHLHLLVKIGPCDLSRFVGQIKGAVSYRFNHEFNPLAEFKWQGGFGILSLRESDTPRVIRYVENQEAIHAARGTGTSDLLERAESPSNT